MSSQPPSSPPMNDSAGLGGFDNMRPDDEALVAYLDGELDRGSASEIEMKLAGDAQLRRRLNDLRAAWDLLEELPLVEPNPRFAQSTIEMVAMNAASLSDKQVDHRTRWRWAIATLLILPLMFALGYAAVRASQRLAESQAIEQLHILADWDALKNVGSYEWLQQIRSVRDLDRVTKRLSSAGLGNGAVPITNSERRAWIQSLSGTSRDRLSANLVDFKRASPADRERITQLAKQIYQGADPLGDLQAARDYSHFLSEMSVSDRANHLDQSDWTKRLDDLTRRVNRRLVEVYTQELTPDSPDRMAVAQWLEDMKAKYGEELPRGPQSDLMRRVIFDSYSVIGDEDLDDLLQSLTPEAQEIIGRIRSKEAQYFALIFYFINDTRSFFPGGGGGRLPDRATLTKRFEALPPSRKGVIEFLPPEIAQGSLGMPSEAGPAPGNGGSRSPGNGGSRAPGRVPGSFTPSFNPGGGSPGSNSKLGQEVIERRENKATSESP